MSLSFGLKKLNDKIINPIEVHHPDPSKIKGYEVFPLLYGTMFLAARKGSGKTNVVFKVMQECIGKNTKVIVFCSTHNSDYNWMHIKRWLEARGQSNRFYMSIFEDGISNLQVLVTAINNIHEEEQANKIKTNQDRQTRQPLPVFDLFGDGIQQEQTEKAVKPKKQSPDFFIVLDDISGELRAKKDVQLLLKHHRHLRTKIVISSQFPTDLDPASRTQIDIWGLFKGFGEDKLKDLFPQLDLRDVDFEEFYDLYKYATTDPHNFLYIDRINNTFRKNLDQQILITNK